MKTRAGFVSNSSTSSFVCQVCGGDWQGMDDSSYEDIGFTECKDGHAWCPDCHTKYGDKCQICSLAVIEDLNVINYLLAITNKTREEIMAEIRNRFKNFTEMAEFLKKSRDFFPKRRDINED